MRPPMNLLRCRNSTRLSSTASKAPVAASTAAPTMPPKQAQISTEIPNVKGAKKRPAMSPRNAPERSPRNAPKEAKHGPVTPVRIKGAATCSTCPSRGFVQPDGMLVAKQRSPREAPRITPPVHPKAAPNMRPPRAPKKQQAGAENPKVSGAKRDPAAAPAAAPSTRPSTAEIAPTKRPPTRPPCHAVAHIVKPCTSSALSLTFSATSSPHFGCAMVTVEETGKMVEHCMK
mmetsp:Transcript_16847/g.28805  ORF Transcript_16847/g.28805 Transcript_16847/m.28805 type:complete len:231 (+) Transcript_16847:322-1014(+)